MRAAVAGEVASLWPEARGLMPPEFGRDVDRLCLLELSRELDAGRGRAARRRRRAGRRGQRAPPRDRRRDRRRARSSSSGSTSGRCGISPLLPIAATQPHGEAIRLDALRGKLAADLRERLQLADDDRELAEALDRWELSLFAEEPFRSGQLHDALTALLGGGDGAWAAALRAAVLLGEKTAERVELLEALRAEHLGVPRGTRSGARSSRRSCTATAPTLVRTLDETLLGVRPRPATVLAA